MQTLQTLAGIILVLAGLVFIGQGAGYIPWPPESFMIGQIQWVYYGVVIAVAGILLFIVGRR
jgi:hypothetical protein